MEEKSLKMDKKKVFQLLLKAGPNTQHAQLAQFT